MAAKRFCLAFLLVAAQCINPQLGHADQQQTERAATSKPTASDTSDTDPLPPGAIARFGTTRFRPGEDNLAVGILPGNRTVVVTKSDGRLLHFNLETGRLIDHKRFSNPYFAAHTTDGRFIAALGEASDAQRHKYTKWVTLVDAKTGEEVIHHELEGNLDLRLIAVAENASAIALQGKDAILLDLANGNEIQWPMERIPYTSAVALSPDGNQLAVGSPGLVRVWKWRESKEPRLFAIPGKDPQRRPTIGSIRFAPDGSQMAMGLHGEDVMLIDLTDGKEVRRFSAGDGIEWRSGDLDRLFFSADGRLLASPFGSGVAVWEVASGKVMQRLNGPASTLAFSSDEKWVVGLRNVGLLVWNVKTGELLGQSLAGHNSPPHTIRFIGDDATSISTCGNDAVHVWTMGVAKPEFEIKHGLRLNTDGDEIRAMDVSPDGKYLATSSMDDTVRLWNRNSGREIFKWPGHGSLGSQRFVRFTPDGKQLVSWGDDMRVVTWEIATGKALHEYRAQPSGEVLPAEGEVPDLPGGVGKFNAACGTLSPDASRLAVVGKGVHIFDVAAGRELLKFDLPAQTRVRQIAISPDNLYLLLLLWGYGEQVPLPGGRIWRESIPRAQLRKLSTGELIAEVERQDQNTFDEGAAFSSDSRLVALTIGKGERSVVVMKVPDLSEVTRIEGFDVAPFAVEFSPSGKLLAVSNADTTVVVYNLTKLPQTN
jgi:WD40 repeat protein